MAGNSQTKLGGTKTTGFQGDDVDRRPSGAGSARGAKSRIPTPEPASGMLASSGPFDPADLFRRSVAEGPAFYIASAAGSLLFANSAFDTLAAQIFLSSESDDRIPAEMLVIFDRIRSDGQPVIERVPAVRGAALGHVVGEHRALRDDRGALIGFAGHYRDVTDEVRALSQLAALRTRYEDVIRSASDWVWETDHHLNLVSISPRIGEILGRPPEALRGANLLMMGRFADQGAERPNLPELFQQQRPFRNRLFLIDDAAGRVRHIHLSGVPVFEENSGRYLGYRGTGTDVTRQYDAERAVGHAAAERGQALSDLQQRNRQLDDALVQAQEAARVKSEFLAMMSHELRTPLNAIIGFADLSQQQLFGPVGPRYLDYFRDISGAAHHLLGIIASILELANLEGAHSPIATEFLPVASLVDEARRLVSMRAHEFGIELVLPKGAGDYVIRANPVRCRQILVNLLDNAMKFTPKGGRVGIDIAPEADGMVAIAVWDTGVGISAAEQQRIFDSFYQSADSRPVRGPGGLGLGLTISRYLGRLMGGDIRVSSESGHGARFTVTLPAAPAS